VLDGCTFPFSFSYIPPIFLALLRSSAFVLLKERCSRHLHSMLLIITAYECIGVEYHHLGDLSSAAMNLQKAHELARTHLAAEPGIQQPDQALHALARMAETVRMVRAPCLTRGCDSFN
jgi:hypothetical protein